ncbi:hypothetical protein K474DRAFT_1704538 [Panus rudis PR-1116 ss-1]|nr:hypothetical protein K474DRAFT_1704538 [Panus rudis PR-1116 ss-1]
MTTFYPPSSSSSSDVTDIAGQSPVKDNLATGRKGKGKEVDRRRRQDKQRRQDLLAKRDQIIAAYQCPKDIYVGNLHPAVTERDLREVFAPSKLITRMQIRSLGGMISSPGIGEPGPSTEATGTVFAYIEFKNQFAAHRAIRVNNGKVLHGLPMMATYSFTKLPEFQTVLQNARCRKTPPAEMIQPGMSSPTPLSSQATQIIAD